MTDFTTIEGDPVDRLLRELLMGPLLAEPEMFEQAQARSRAATRERLRAERASERRRWRWRWRALAVVVPVAAALLVVLAVLPGEDGSNAPLSRLGDSAGAAEVFDAAGVALRERVDVAGSGPVWHGVSRTYLEGRLVSLNEQWYHSRTPGNLLVGWGRDTTFRHQEVLIIDRVDPDGTQRVRTFVRPEGRDWQMPDVPSPTRALDIPEGAGDRQRQLATAMHEWLAVVSHAGADDAAVRAATETFISSTPDVFTAQPEHADRDRGERPDRDAREDFQRLQEAVRIRQLLYLLTAVQVEPGPTAVLYDMLGRLESLGRLPDVMIEGRPAVRLRFDMSDPAVSPTRQRVVVLDADTGRIIRTETLDRKSWTVIEPPRLVPQVGDDREVCTVATDLPCELIDGEGELAQLADREAQSPTTLDNVTPTLRDDSSFATSIAIADLTDLDGIARGQGECYRDWRLLTICRG